MPSIWASRLYFAVIAVLGMAAFASGTACTRWGQPGPVPPTLAPLSKLFVNPSTGSDSSGNGSEAKPYKTLTKAIEVLSSAKRISNSGVTIGLAIGDYDANKGEKFPIVVPTDVTIVGTNFGTGPRGGSFIDGAGQDTLFEEAVRAPSRSAYTTFEVAPGVSVTLNDVYVGAARLKLNSHAQYWSVDVLGMLDASVAGFGSGIVSRSPNISGMLVAGGSLTCGSCQITGNNFGVGALSITAPTAYPSASPSSSPPSTTPNVTLMHSSSDSTISARNADLLTDGSVDVTASEEHFEQSKYAFSDAFEPVVIVPVRGAVDFGGGAAQSQGGNVFIGAHIAEIYVSRRFTTVSALDDTWNPHVQRANGSGLYVRKITFGSGTVGRNVTILHHADASTVTVGPAPVPTPTASATPSTSPSSTPTP
jgi:Protein of unknown function (DUF1565)